MKKLIALILALLSGWVLFLPFDLPPFPFMFIDEGIALVIFTKSVAYLGFDITKYLPFLRGLRGKKGGSTPPPMNKAADTTTIDV